MSLNFLDKMNFKSFFNLQLSQYATYIDMQRANGQCNYREMEAAKEAFSDNLFEYCERMITKNHVISQPSNKQDNASTEVPSGGESGKMQNSST